MMGAMNGKVAVVTGASKGMGRSFARLLAARGAKVAALARPSEALDGVAAELGDRGLAIACDMSVASEVTAAVNRAAEHFGALDCLVNNAAVVDVLKLETTTDAQIEWQFAANLFGSIYATRAAIPHLRAGGGGDLVFISSESVRMAFPGLTLYTASKAAIEGLALGLRRELRAQGVRVTVLRSGAVDTQSISGDWPAEKLADFLAEARQSGCLDFSGAYAAPDSMAEALLAVLSLPRDVNVDLIEPRASAPLPG